MTETPSDKADMSAPANDILRAADLLAAALDEGTIEQAKRKASVLVAEDSKFQA